MEKIIIHTEEEARQYAIDWQAWTSKQDLSYGELAEWQTYFMNVAKGFNIEEEFRENGII